MYVTIIWPKRFYGDKTMIYEYQCTDCDKVHDISRLVEQRDEPFYCTGCGKITRRKIGSGVNGNSGRGSRMGSVCTSLPGNPVYVKDKNHFRELCKEHDLYPAGL